MPDNLTVTTMAARMFLAWRRHRDDAALAELIRHPAYQTVLLHSDHLAQSPLSAEDFRRAADGLPNGLGGVRDLEAHEPAILKLLDEIDARSDALAALVSECLAPIFTPAERSDIAIHCIIGYDMGIGLSGNVAMNMNAPIYLGNPAEVGYWIAHEAAHVAYERVHGPLDFRRIREPGELRRAVCILIQTEGMSVYAPLAARLRDGQLADRDYQALLDPPVLAAKTARLQALVASLTTDYPGDEALDSIFERLSGERLSYVVGCDIFRRIHDESGNAGVRAALEDDPEVFVARGLALLNR